VTRPDDLRRLIALKKCKSLESLQSVSLSDDAFEQPASEPEAAASSQFSSSPTVLIEDDSTTAVPQGVTPGVTPVRMMKGLERGRRVCGGNESFRAAIDRSYSLSTPEIMETGKVFSCIVLVR